MPDQILLVLAKDQRGELGTRCARFTCFTGTKLHTDAEALGTRCARFTCFTGTTVHILMQKRCGTRCSRAECDRTGNCVYGRHWGCFTCFTGLKSTNTDAEGAASRWRAESGRGELLVRAALGVRQVRSLLALLVQMYAY
jgi:hypothetical protein